MMLLLKIKIPIKTIKNKFLVTMLLLTFLPLLIQTNTSLETSKNIMEKNYIDNYHASLNASSSNLDLLIEPIINLARSIIAEKELQNKLRKAKDKPLTSMEVQLIEKVFAKAMSQSLYIDSIYLFTENNKIYYRHKNNNVSWYTRNIDFNKMRQMKWYLDVEAASGKEIFICDNVLAQMTGGLVSSDKYITCAKLFRNIDYPYEKQGILVINLRKELLSSVLAAYTSDEQAGSYIYDAANGAFYTKDKSDPEIIQAKLGAIKASLKDDAYRDEQFIISSADNKTTGWQLYNIAERDWLGKKSDAIAFRAVGIAATMFIVVAVAFVFISNAINSPLSKLERVIKKFSKGQYDIKEQFDDSEIGEIGSQFVAVVNNNLKLQNDLMMSMVKQKEAEMMAMQEQINPHFLYNTLDLLYWKAEMNEEREIADLTIALSNIFKLTLNSGKLLIDVRDEIEHIKYYLHIQKARYEARLETEIDISQEVFEYKLIKLLLQPIVENAICHGIEPKIEGGKVSIRGRYKDEKLIFTVTDNGVGFEDQNVVQNGYGLKNVKERIKLYYGDECGIEVKSKLNEGTSVTIGVKAVKS